MAYYFLHIPLVLLFAIAMPLMHGCKEPLSIAEYEKQTTKVLTFDLQSVSPSEDDSPITQIVDGHTMTIDGLIAKKGIPEDENPENMYVFGLGNPGFTATVNLADPLGNPENFSVDSINVSNNNQFKPGARELPRCPVYATGLRNEKEIFKDYLIGPSYGVARQFNTFRFRQAAQIDTLVLRAEPTRKEYFPSFDDFVLRVCYVRK